MLLALRQALGPHLTLRADANKRWALQEAIAFGLAAAAAGLEVTIACWLCWLLAPACGAPQWNCASCDWLAVTCRASLGVVAHIA